MGTFSIVLTHEFMFYDTAIMLAAFLMLGRYLEARAKGRTSDAIKKLAGLQAKTATVIHDGKETEVAIEDLVVGDIVIAKPGQQDPGGRRGGGRRELRGRSDDHRGTGPAPESEREPGGRRHDQHERRPLGQGHKDREGDRPCADCQTRRGCTGVKAAGPADRRCRGRGTLSRSSLSSPRPHSSCGTSCSVRRCSLPSPRSSPCSWLPAPVRSALPRRQQLPWGSDGARNWESSSRTARRLRSQKRSRPSSSTRPVRLPGENRR